MKNTILYAIILATGIVCCSVSAEEGYIDTHVHLAGRQRDKSAQDLVEHMDRYGVSKALIMPPPQVTGQRGPGSYKVIAGIVASYPDRLVLVGGGNLLNPLIHEYEREEVTPDHPLYFLLADLAAEYNVPVDIHMEAVLERMPTPANILRVSSRNPDELQPNIAAFERLLSHNRKARIVWQHIGWDNIGNMTVELLRRLLAAHENLYLALRVEDRPFRVASRMPMPNRIVDEDWQVKPEWLELIAEFPDHFVIGTDEFFGTPGFGHDSPQSFEETWYILDQFPPDIARKVGRDNAARVYSLLTSSKPGLEFNSNPGLSFKAPIKRDTQP